MRLLLVLLLADSNLLLVDSNLLLVDSNLLMVDSTRRNAWSNIRWVVVVTVVSLWFEGNGHCIIV